MRARAAAEPEVDVAADHAIERGARQRRPGSAWAAYQRLGAPQTHAKPSLSNRSRTASNSARDSVLEQRERVRVGHRDAVAADVPVGRRDQAPGPVGRRRCRRPRRPAPRTAARRRRRASPRPRPARARAAATSVYSSPVSGGCGVRRFSRRSRFGRASVGRTCRASCDNAEANGISRCMRAIIGAVRAARRSRTLL